jgi:two-component system response regulator HydG
VGKASVLVVDDSAEMVATLARYLGDHGWEVRTATGGAEALESFAQLPADVVLTDLRMKGAGGMEVLEGIHRVDRQTPVVIMTAFGNIESAVDAIQRGAHHYVAKPFKMATVRVLLERALEQLGIQRENRQLKSWFGERFSSRGLIGETVAMRELKGLIDRVADTSSPVLIVGETGTGKELVARAIHTESDRREKPFVAVSCAALPETLLESELFGHTAGAFPGAVKARGGLFAEADGGTLFLDEVGDIPAPLQGKLLRVLQSGEIRAVGGDTARQVNVRFIASTHEDLAALVAAHRFREDLFFRLNVLSLRVPPLRERRQDIPALVGYFLREVHRRHEKVEPRAITADALRVLESHAWPGNVRELENVIERLVVTPSGREIDGAAVRGVLSPAPPADPIEALASSGLTLDELEARYTAAVLRREGGNKSKTAAVLGVDLSTLYRRAMRNKRP